MLLKERKKEIKKERKKERKFFLQKTTTHKNNLSFFHFPPVSFLAILQILGCAFLLFQVFQFFSPHSRSYHVSFSFSSFVRFLAIFQVQQCVCLIFHVFDFLALFQVLSCALFIFHIFQFSGHIPGPTVCVSHFARLKVFLAIFWVLEFAFLSFHFFLCFSPYSRSYSVHFSFSTFLSVSRHIPGLFL